MEHILNKEQFEVFKPSEPDFNLVLTYRYKLATNFANDVKLGEIYKEVTGRSLQNWNCSTCAFNNYVELGKLYFKSKEYYESQPTEAPLKTTKKSKKQ